MTYRYDCIECSKSFTSETRTDATTCDECKKTLKLEKSEAEFLGYVLGYLNRREIEQTTTIFESRGLETSAEITRTLFEKVERFIEAHDVDYHGPEA